MVAGDELPKSDPKGWVALRKAEMDLALHWAMMMGALGYLCGAKEVVVGEEDPDEHEIKIPKAVVIKYIKTYKDVLAKRLNAQTGGAR